MSYVSIWKPVSERIIEASRGNENEIIGLLLGRLENDTIIIEDSITGEFFSEPEQVTLPSRTLAKIADDLVSKRVKGNIVGWYHSHTKGGMFFSESDIQTQKKLQQFSELIVAIVVDVQTGDVGYFRVDSQTGKPARMLPTKIRVYEKESEAVPESRKKPIGPTIEVRERRPQLIQPTLTMILSLVLIALVVSLAFLGVVIYRGLPTGPAVSIVHNPVSRAIVGTPLEINAIVNGTVRSVTLSYSSAGATSFAETAMNSAGPGAYSYVIPGERVAGNVVYYIRATDTSGNSVQTSSFTIQTSDFTFLTRNLAVKVYRSSSARIELAFLPTNGFSQEVTLSATGVPQGMTVTFDPNPVSFGTGSSTMNIIANPSMTLGNFTLVVTGTYRPSGAAEVARQTTATVTVGDFDVQVSPTSRTILRGQTATYTVTLTIHAGFTDSIIVGVEGLPPGATAQLTAGGTTLPVGGAGTKTITLQIVTTTLVKSGSYALTVVAVGSGIAHSQTVQLIVR